MHCRPVENSAGIQPLRPQLPIAAARGQWRHIARQRLVDLRIYLLRIGIRRHKQRGGDIDDLRFQ